MPKHFFPSHVVEVVAEALWKPSEEPVPRMSGSYSDSQVSDKYEPSELRSGYNRIGFGRS